MCAYTVPGRIRSPKAISVAAKKAQQWWSVRLKIQLFCVFLIIQVVMVILFLTAVWHAIALASSNYAAMCNDSVGSVHQSVAKKVLQMQDGLQNIAYNRDLQRYCDGANTTANMKLVIPLMQYIQVSIA